MKIAFCTTCKGRLPHLQRTLPQNLADNADYKDAVFIVLDYNCAGRTGDYLRATYPKEIASGRLQVYNYGGEHPFRMSHAKNMAHRLAIMQGADVLVNMDADNWAAPGFAHWMADRFRHGAQYLWSNAKSVNGRARQGLAGRIAMTASLFIKVGGYDERYSGWAPEDQDLKARMRRLTGDDGERIINDFLYVIPHKDGLRFSEYPDAKPTPESEAAALRRIVDSSDTITNFGNFGCGTVNRDGLQIGLLPIPTRVFGIGMHKTGTTSLHEAFRVLGYDSAHWKAPWWAKKVWDEMQAGRSAEVEQHYAMCDLPFSMLFKKLDRAYPGSKFILTRRDERRWLQSVKNHWDYNVNPWRKTWDNDCFTHRVHNMLYGRKTFDADTMLHAYRRHNDDVLAYFRKRPNDLLVMDIDQNPGWGGLCRFLGKHVPQIEYPRAFVTGGKQC